MDKYIYPEINIGISTKKCLQLFDKWGFFLKNLCKFSKVESGNTVYRLMAFLMYLKIAAISVYYLYVNGCRGSQKIKRREFFKVKHCNF